MVGRSILNIRRMKVSDMKKDRTHWILIHQADTGFLEAVARHRRQPFSVYTIRRRTLYCSLCGSRRAIIL